MTLDDQTRSDAARHVENPTPGCECHGDTYCEWCGDEWPCTVRRLLDALEPADLVQGDAKLRENSGDADATENHKNGSER